MITAGNIALHELIGLHARVVDSTNQHVIGLNGTVIDETKSMLRIDTAKGTKSVPKDTSTWEFFTGSERVTVPGAKIAKRPFDRLRGKA